MKQLFLLVCIMAAVGSRAQTNLYVDSSVTASGAGTSWSAAYKTLNEALNTANAGSTSVKYVVNIARGTYYPTGVQSGTNQDSTFLIARGGIRLLGGYPTGGGSRNAVINPTVLSGNIGAATISDNSFHILTAANIPSTGDSIVLDGLNFTGGNANGIMTKTYNSISVPRSNGGAVYDILVRAKLLISNCRFANNSASLGGGAICNDSTHAYLSGCSFMNNTATAGGAISSFYTNAGAAITNCSFVGNTATGNGGALYYQDYSSGSRISSCSFSANAAPSGGAAYFLARLTSGTGNWIDSCVFTANNATGTSISYKGGGAIVSNPIGTIGDRISNSIFTGNTSSKFGGAVSIDGFLTSPFTCISKCSFTGNTALSEGGGAMIFLSTSLGHSTIDSSVFTGNKAGGDGGGLFFNESSGTVRNCRFQSDTSATRGGGIFIASGINIYNCSVMLNRANKGGGIYTISSNGNKVQYDTVQGNTAIADGGGIYSTRPVGTFQIDNCLITGNQAGNHGGALCDSLSSPDISNCTFAADTASTGNGIYNEASSPSIVNCIIWDGAGSIVNVSGSFPSVTYSTIANGYSGTGNIPYNPRFAAPVSASAAPVTGGDFQLISCSPAIDMGTIYSPTWSATDLDGNARQYGPNIDHGAYEFAGPPSLNGVAELCAGTSSQYTHIVSGGTWHISDTSVATISNTGLLTAKSPGLDTISYTVSGTGPCAGTFYFVVTVNPMQIGPITGPDSVCASNSTIYLFHALPGGIWSVSDTNLAAIYSNGMLTTKTGSGPDTVYYTFTYSGGCSASASKVVTIQPAPAIPVLTGPSTVCQHDGIFLLNASTAGGVWGSMDVLVADIDSNGLVTPIGNGIGTFYYYTIFPNNCYSQATLHVTVHAFDTAIGETWGTLISRQPFGPYTWLECHNGSFTVIPGATSQTFTPPAGGEYAVALEDSVCRDTSGCYTYTMLGAGPLLQGEPAFTLAPNPSAGLVMVKCNQTGVLRMYDVTGREVNTVILDRTGVATSIDLRWLPAGVYMYRFTSANGSTKSGRLTIKD